MVWTQVGLDGSLQARAVVAGDCPAISLNGQDSTMAVRSGPTADSFADTVCEAAIPAGISEASVGRQPLALLPETVDRVAVVGDPGCRVSHWEAIQDCDDPADWPLRAIAAEIAESAPHLVVHVGDYIYRETPCPPGEASCAGSPFGDNQATWQADFFDPMSRLLPVAPWLFLRGNHESCSREGVGWFRYFDPRPMPAACERFTAPYAVDLAGLPRLVVMDTAEAGDSETTPELNAAYAEQLASLERLATPGSWLLTHKPVAGGILYLDGKEQVVTNETFSAVSNNHLPATLNLALAGHIHLAEVLLFDPGASRPTQLIAGHGGTELDQGVSGAYDGAFLGEPALKAGLVVAAFGWMEVAVAPDRITATALGVEGRELFVVHLARE
ncbi:MAG: metallophosphoesterase [Chloroflexia bacterium]|nr:metallophosphoesterase [Chloroflexia bacterium]